MELYILELKKLPPEDQNEEGVIRWMRFLGGKKREEFAHMAERDEYIGEAYDELKKLSLDEQKKIERGLSPEEIAELFELDPEEVYRLTEEWKTGKQYGEAESPE